MVRRRTVQQTGKGTNTSQKPHADVVTGVPDEHVPAGVRSRQRTTLALLHDTDRVHLQATRRCSSMHTSQRKLSRIQTALARRKLKSQEYVGTLRWAPQVRLPSLPKRTTASVLDNWPTWISARLTGSEYFKGDTLELPGPELIDGALGQM